MWIAYQKTGHQLVAMEAIHLGVALCPLTGVAATWTVAVERRREVTRAAILAVKDREVRVTLELAAIQVVAACLVVAILLAVVAIPLAVVVILLAVAAILSRPKATS
jgi:hypothetical protein